MADGAGGFIETERKFDAEAGFALPDLAGLDGVAAVTGPQTYRLRAIYFDTADFRLAAARITLRRRTGGTDAGWHLKLPAGADSRREVHAPLGRGASSVPSRLAELVAGWTGGQPLRPIARLATTRRLRRLAGRDGEVLAEVADDLVIGSLPGPAPGGPGGPGGPGMPEWREASRWREIEIELVTGPRELLGSAGGRLRRAGAVPSAEASKLSRLLASAPGTP
ncbi:MAG TPA: CYTH domain-containing protein [Streptosporangiaceae bacterium]